VHVYIHRNTAHHLFSLLALQNLSHCIFCHFRQEGQQGHYCAFSLGQVRKAEGGRKIIAACDVNFLVEKPPFLSFFYFQQKVIYKRWWR